MEDLRTEIETSHREELNDKKKYEELADMAHKNGNHKASLIFRDLSHEEHTHAKILEELLSSL